MERRRAHHLIEVGVAVRPLPGQRLAGDRQLVLEHARGALLAVADGAGHGESARESADMLVDEITKRHSADLITIIRSCHSRLRRARGAAVTVATVDATAHTLSWLAVGNVEAVAFDVDDGKEVARRFVLQRGGLVGHQLPPLRVATVPIRPGAVVVFATDGVRPEFSSAVPLAAPAQSAADQILGDYAIDTDDALVMVARYRGLLR